MASSPSWPSAHTGVLAQVRPGRGIPGTQGDQLQKIIARLQRHVFFVSLASSLVLVAGVNWLGMDSRGALAELESE